MTTEPEPATAEPPATQDAIVALLADPATYAHRPARVEHIQTHISHVFLAGPFVYKLKKAVRFSFLDFATLDRRRFFSAEELRLNRRLAAPVYLDVVEVVRRADGTLALGSAGTPLEPVLRMRRLPADRMLPALLARDAVDATMMARLAARIAAFHREAPTSPAIAAHAAPAALQARWDDTLRTLAPFVDTVVPAETHAMLVDFGPWYVARHAAAFRARQEGGHVRDGHGDLHAEHVCFVDAASDSGIPPGIYVFDCIEFSEPFRCNDVASEIAFLTMDLERRGRRDLADAFADAYIANSGDAALEKTGDAAIATLRPYYTAARACVRAAVACLKSAEPEVAADERAAAAAEARTYLALAGRAAWSAAGPALIACAGLSGTGKSTLAAELATATGFIWLRSDAIRKREDGEGRPPTAAIRYAPEARAAVYATLAREADAALAAGHGVIADATFLGRADRDRMAQVAAARGCPFVVLETTAPAAVVRARLAARPAGDLSDARVDTWIAQQRDAEPFGADEPLIRVATDRPLAVVAATALAALWRWRKKALELRALAPVRT